MRSNVKLFRYFATNNETVRCCKHTHTQIQIQKKKNKSHGRCTSYAMYHVPCDMLWYGRDRDYRLLAPFIYHFDFILFLYEYIHILYI